MRSDKVPSAWPEFCESIARALDPFGFKEEARLELLGFDAEISFRNAEALRIRFAYQIREGIVAITLDAPNFVGSPVNYSRALQAVGIDPSPLARLQRFEGPLNGYFAALVDAVQATISRLLRTCGTPAQLEDIRRGNAGAFDDG